MKNCVQNVQLKFVCNQDWDAMKPVARGKYCDKCSKKVYDFRNAKEDEFRQVLLKTPGLCGMFNTDQVSTIGIKLPLWKKYISAALLLIGVNLFNRPNAQAQISDSTKRHTESTHTSKQNMVFGGVEELAKFPGGYEKLQKFIQRNLHYSGNVTGRVILQFIVEADGLLSDIKIAKGLSKEADDEALRVVKLSPKWRPGIENSKPIRQQYTLPVVWAPVK